MKRRTAIWIGIIAALVLLGALAQICRICREELRREQAEALLEAGAYAHARKLYDGIGDAEGVAHCNAMQAEEVYQEGKQFLMTGDCEGARQLLASLGSYKDTAALLAACGWQEALAHEDTEALIEAHRGFQSLGQNSACQDIIKQISERLFTQAEELAAAFKLGKPARFGRSWATMRAARCCSGGVSGRSTGPQHRRSKGCLNRQTAISASPWKTSMFARKLILLSRRNAAAKPASSSIIRAAGTRRCPWTICSTT